jgi:hypothetical protein
MVPDLARIAWVGRGVIIDDWLVHVTRPPCFRIESEREAAENRFLASWQHLRGCIAIVCNETSVPRQPHTRGHGSPLGRRSQTTAGSCPRARQFMDRWQLAGNGCRRRQENDLSMLCMKDQRHMPVCPCPAPISEDCHCRTSPCSNGDCLVLLLSRGTEMICATGPVFRCVTTADLEVPGRSCEQGRKQVWFLLDKALVERIGSGGH